MAGPYNWGNLNAQEAFFQSLKAPGAMVSSPGLVAEPVASSLVETRAKPVRQAPRMTSLKPIVTPEVQASIDEIQRGRQAVQNQQMSQNAALEADLAAAMNRDFQTDLSPLASLVDEWSGGGLAQSYARPESIQARQKEIAGLEQGIRSGQTEMLGTELQNLESDLSRDLKFDELGYNRGFQNDRAAIEDFYREEELGLRRDEIAARVKAEQAASGLKQTDGEKAADATFGRDYAEYVAGGGHATAEKNLQQLELAAQRLGSDDSLSGGVTGATPDWMLAYTNPQAKLVKDDINQVVMASLKQLLGSAFTQKEGERVLSATYDDKLPAKENSKRLARLQQQMAIAFEQKRRASEYFENNRKSLSGFKGYIPSVDALIEGAKQDVRKPTTVDEKRAEIARLKREAGEE